MPIRHAVLSLAALAALAACDAQRDATPAPAAPVSEPLAAPQADPVPATDATSAEFDITRFPVSTVTLGAFPYISLPAGYTNQGYGRTDKDFARFPFWIDGKAHWVEGRFHGEIFYPEQGKDFSAFEVRRNFETLIQQMGGQKVSEGRIPTNEIEAWGDEITQGFIDGLGDVYSDPASVYLVRRPEGNIWLHLVLGSTGGAYVIGQEKAFAQTATLLPASELKQQLEAAGKVALQVHFATDKTDILPESQPQIAQVVQLLKDDPALKLAVNGHTDNTGEAAHNQALSEGRARSVMAALTTAGIAAERLTAAGFGDTQPVADNTSEEGKARNRRVELVKR